jgi:hypothetical protein
MVNIKYSNIPPQTQCIGKSKGKEIGMEPS